METALTLTDFLLARIAEDEAGARECPPWPWRVATLEDETTAHDEQTYAGETVAAADGICVAVPYALSGNQERVVRDHIARHDPARVLAECEAKRRIVEDCRDCTWGCGDEPNCHDCIILGHLALPYADHDDYREEWR